MRLRILLVVLSVSWLYQNVVVTQSHGAAVVVVQGELNSYIVDPSSHGGTPLLNPTAKLEKSVELAKQGEIDQAFEMALSTDTNHLQPQNPLFSVEYLNTLLEIADRAEAPQRGRIVNEAIRTVNSLKSNLNFNGRNNPETAYHFMVSVGRLAEMSMPLSVPTGVSLQSCQGTIARNLKMNPQFPADGKESLAEPMVNLAKAHAAKHDQPAAMQAISEACDLGYCDFEKLSESPVLKQLADQASWEAHLTSLNEAYLVKVKQWSAQEIQDFQTFGFQFRMDDVEGGSLANRDFDNKILVVDFWATWCPPCRDGIPHFVQLQDELEKKDVQVVGISMDAPEDPRSVRKTVRNFLTKNKVNYPCGLGTPSLKHRVPGDMKLPTTLFIDRSGTVRYMATGYHDYAKLAAIAETLANEEQPVSSPNHN